MTKFKISNEKEFKGQKIITTCLQNSKQNKIVCYCYKRNLLFSFMVKNGKNILKNKFIGKW